MSPVSPLTADVFVCGGGDLNDRKYLVGADRERSFVRKNSGIELIGEKSGAEWIRMDVSRVESTFSFIGCH
jgi:hypothetical protein